MTSPSWTPVGHLGRARHHGTRWDLDGPDAQVRIEACAPHVVRIRVARNGCARDPDQSLSVIDRHPASPHAHGDAADDRTTVEMAGLRIEVAHQPLRVVVKDADGHELCVDDPDRGTVFAGSDRQRIETHMRLWTGERVYGLGEKNGPHDHRGARFQGTSRVLWNTDHFAHDAGSDPVYACVPLLLFLRDGRCHGLFVDEPGRLHVDIGHADTDVLTLRARHGVLDRYVIAGPTPKDVLSRYAKLTGVPPMPPRWALGLHQCRYSYDDAATVRWLASTFRQRRIPCDALWLDIHHLEGFRPLRWNRALFPDPAGLCDDLRAQGFRLVTIVDPHLAAAEDDPNYRSGRDGGHLMTWPDGAEYRAPVWPQRGPEPCDSVFPDYARADTRTWWGDRLKELCDDGVAGVWNDMNEPSVFDRLDATFPPDLVHDGDLGRVRHDEVHNAYGALMTRASFEGLARHRPAERPFVLTRSTWAGGQRWAFCWTGDVRSTWSSLRQSIVTLLSMSVSGLPMVGADVGGFVGEPSAELFTRWLQACVLTPFFRIHTDLATADQEPWSYGHAREALNRRAIELRYELLPQIERVVRQAHETGWPVMRPLWFEYPEYGAGWSIEDQFLLGRDLLVAPVLWPDASRRTIHLPPGAWFDLETGQRFEGPGSVTVPVDDGSLPVLARGGTILFRQPPIPHTGAVDGVARIIEVFPAERSSARMVEDDGITPDGPTAVRRLVHERSDAHVSLTLGAVKGAFRAAARPLVIRFHGVGKVQRVRVGRHVVGALDGIDTTVDSGWRRLENGRVEVTMPDTPDAVKVSVDVGDGTRPR